MKHYFMGDVINWKGKGWYEQRPTKHRLLSEEGSEWVCLGNNINDRSTSGRWYSSLVNLKHEINNYIFINEEYAIQRGELLYNELCTDQKFFEYVRTINAELILKANIYIAELLEYLEYEYIMPDKTPVPLYKFKEPCGIYSFKNHYYFIVNYDINKGYVSIDGNFKNKIEIYPYCINDYIQGNVPINRIKFAVDDILYLYNYNLELSKTLFNSILYKEIS